MNVMMLFMDMDKAVGPDFEHGLSNLKSILEETPSPAEEVVPVEEETTPA